MKTVVIIPIYGTAKAITPSEWASVKQSFKVLQEYDIIFIAGKSFDFNDFSNQSKDFNNNKCEFFEDSYFKSAMDYNSLLLNIDFYKRFSRYNFMLISQLDSWVFKNDLDYWSNAGYDYIGAPWFDGWHKAAHNKEIIGVGNGGFSLRNIEKSIVILKRISALKMLFKLSFSQNEQGNFLFKTALFFLHNFFKISNRGIIYKILKPNNINEDVFWCMVAGKVFNDFKIAPVSEAIKFSFEANPEYLFKINNEQLPFGCHAWERYNPTFWKQFITNC